MTLSWLYNTTHLVKRMSSWAHQSSSAGRRRLVDWVVFIAAWLALAGCGERRPAAGMRVAFDGEYGLVGSPGAVFGVAFLQSFVR